MLEGDETYLTPRELCSRWRNSVSEKTLANWRSDPNEPGPGYLKFGNRVLYPLSQVKEFENDRARSMRPIKAIAS